MFSPPLPGDNLLNVFVVENRLVLLNYFVQQAHTNASLNPSKNNKLSHNPMTERTLFHPVGSLL